jgi:hypothetical protein
MRALTLFDFPLSGVLVDEPQRRSYKKGRSKSGRPPAECHPDRPENLELWASVQPRGQRVEELIAFVVAQYPQDVLAKLLESWESQPSIRVRRGIRG